VVGRVEETQ